MLSSRIQWTSIGDSISFLKVTLDFPQDGIDVLKIPMNSLTGWVLLQDPIDFLMDPIELLGLLALDDSIACLG